MGEDPHAGGHSVKVMFVLNSLGAGGTERSTSLLVRALADLGVSSTVVVMKRATEGDHDGLLTDGYDVRVLAAKTTLSRILEVRRLIGDERPDVVHTAITEADLIGRLACLGAEVPLVSSLVNTPYADARFDDPSVTRWKVRLLQLVDAITARRVTRFHAVTEGVAMHARRTLRIPAHRIEVVERGRELQSLQPRPVEERFQLRQRLGLPDQAPVLLAIGRHEYQKGLDVFVRAVALVRSERPDVVGLIAGRPGHATSLIEAETERLGLADTIRLLGHRSDVPDLLAAADVFVLSSRYEGTAGVLIEAMASAVPVVCTDLEGLYGVVPSSVERTRPDDELALAHAVIRSLDRPTEVKPLAETFDLQTHAARMHELYRATVRANRGRMPARARG